MLIQAIPVERHPAEDNEWWINATYIVKGCFDRMRELYFVTLHDGTEWVITKTMFDRLKYHNPIADMEAYNTQERKVA